MRRNWNRRMMGTMPMYQQGGWGSPTIIVIPMCQHCGAGCPMMGMNGNAPRHGMAMHRGFGPKGGRPYMNGRGMMNGPDRRRHWKHGKDKNDCSCDRCKCGGDDDDDRRFKKGKKRDQWKQDKYEKPGKERRKDRPRRGRDDY